ncbi:hypothetical protein BpHYR1_050732, partial [Brachionus plicatilis]
RSTNLLYLVKTHFNPYITVGPDKLCIIGSTFFGKEILTRLTPFLMVLSLYVSSEMSSILSPSIFKTCQLTDFVIAGFLYKEVRCIKRISLNGGSLYGGSTYKLVQYKLKLTCTHFVLRLFFFNSSALPQLFLISLIYNLSCLLHYLAFCIYNIILCKI